MTEQCEYHAAAHGISNLGPSLASEKTYLLCRSELRAQRSEPRTFGTIANNFATQSRMALLNRTESSQQQFVTLTGDKIADAEYDIGRQRIQFWIENMWINSVVNHGGRKWPTGVSFYFLAHSFADANNRARRAVDLLRNSLTPLACVSTDLVCKKSIQPVHCNHKWNTQLAAQQCCRVAARQSGMGVNKIYGVPSMNPSNCVENTGEKTGARNWQTHAARK